MDFSAKKPDLAGKKIVVVGLAKTGRAAVEFLLGLGAEVIGTDFRPIEEMPVNIRELADKGAVLELGGHKIDSFTKADLIVVSPGVPPTIEPLRAARENGVPVTGELELASRFTDLPLVAVTGTNGKTTTTSLIGEILRRTDRKVFVGGNIGAPLAGFLTSGENADAAVLEVSSFQLETADSFRPDVGLLLNISPDHLDRHNGLEEYLQLKARIFRRQRPDQIAILNADDGALSGLKINARTMTFSRRRRPVNGAFVDRERLLILDGGKVAGEIPISGISLVGAHNQENIMAACLAAVAMGVSPGAALSIAADFKGLPHRVEHVGTWNGVAYYDDSKGTNVGAVVKSLEGFDSPVVLIAGGRDKAGDFNLLKELVRKKVKLLVLLGEAREKIASVLSGDAETILVESMEEAVLTAKNKAVSGDVVLLSPACASFDMFDDYAHRGRVFAEWAGKVND